MLSQDGIVEENRVARKVWQRRSHEGEQRRRTRGEEVRETGLVSCKDCRGKVYAPRVRGGVKRVVCCLQGGGSVARQGALVG